MKNVLKVNIWQGDCRERLKDIPDDSVDLILTDPPYELGFMSKGWDATGVAFDTKLYKEMLRVLKPGHWAKIFSATRTFHRVCMAMELAGFLGVKDNLNAWVYGCLDDQSEILTEHGWKSGFDVAIGERVAAWDPQTEAIMLQPVEEVIRAPYKGDMVRFLNDNTDQMLTPNHRVFKKHRVRACKDGYRIAFFQPEWAVMEAAELGRRLTRLPVSGSHDGPGLDGGVRYAEFLAWLWAVGVRRESGAVVMREPLTECPSRFEALVREIDSDCVRIQTHTGSWEFALSETMVRKIRKDLPDLTPDFDFLWRLQIEEKEAILRVLSKGQCSPFSASREWIAALGHLTGRHTEEPSPLKFKLHKGSTIDLDGQHIGREHYDGDVWCVRVPTGAFLARRSNKIFVTGNSGFPKSLRIDKALKAAQKKDPRITDEMIESWKGYGTALKPSWEPIILGAKPT